MRAPTVGTQPAQPAQSPDGVLPAPRHPQHVQGDPTEPQFGNADLARRLAAQGVAPALIEAMCGPIAAAGALKELGIAADPATLAKWGQDSGEWGDVGMTHGGGSGMRAMLAAQGVDSEILGADQGTAAAQAVEAGRPVIINFAGHYLLATDYNPQSGEYYVGNTGANALKGGKAWMTLGEMAALPGTKHELRAFIIPTTAAGASPQQGTPAEATSTTGDSIESFIRERAAAYGIDPDTAVAVANSEGGTQSWNRQSDYVYKGKRETSFGPMQLFMGGGLGDTFMAETGLDPRDPANGPAATDWALRYASQHGWGDWHGAQRLGLDDFAGIGATTPTGTPLRHTSTSAAVAGRQQVDSGYQSPFDPSYSDPARTPQAQPEDWLSNVNANLAHAEQGLADLGRHGARALGTGVGAASDAARGAVGAADAATFDFSRSAVDRLHSHRSATTPASVVRDYETLAGQSAGGVRDTLIKAATNWVRTGNAGDDDAQRLLGQFGGPVVQAILLGGNLEYAAVDPTRQAAVGGALGIARGEDPSDLAAAQARYKALPPLVQAAVGMVLDPAILVGPPAGHGAARAVERAAQEAGNLGADLAGVAPNVTGMPGPVVGRGLEVLGRGGVRGGAGDIVPTLHPQAVVPAAEQVAAYERAVAQTGSAAAAETLQALREEAATGRLGEAKAAQLWQALKADVGEPAANAVLRLDAAAGRATPIAASTVAREATAPAVEQATGDLSHLHPPGEWGVGRVTVSGEEPVPVEDVMSALSDGGGKEWAPHNFVLDNPITMTETYANGKSISLASLFVDAHGNVVQVSIHDGAAEQAYQALDINESGATDASLAFDYGIARVNASRGMDGSEVINVEARAPLSDAQIGAIATLSRSVGGQNAVVYELGWSQPRVSGHGIGQLRRDAERIGFLRDAPFPVAEQAPQGLQRAVADAPVPASGVRPPGGERWQDTLGRWWRTFYHGTGTAFDTPAGDKFSNEGLFGPAYYITSDTRVAGRAPGETPSVGYAFQRSEGLAELQVRLRKAEAEMQTAEASGKDYYIANARNQLRRAQAALEIHYQDTGGPNVRAVDVPEGLRLLDVDAPLATADIERIASTLPARSEELFSNILFPERDPNNMRRLWAPPQPPAEHTGGGVYNALVRAAGLHDVRENGLLLDAKTVAARFLHAAGFDGIRYAGGKRVPMADAAGVPIEHTALAIFPESLPKIRNALSGRQGGSVNAAFAVTHGLSTVGGGAAGGVYGYTTAPPGSTEEQKRARAMQFAKYGAVAGLVGGAGLGLAAAKAPGLAENALLRAGADEAGVLGGAGNMGGMFEETRAPTFGGRQLTPGPEAGGPVPLFDVIDRQGAAARAEREAQGPGLFGKEFAPPPPGPRQVSLGEAPPVEPPPEVPPLAAGDAGDGLVGNAVRAASPSNPSAVYDLRYRVVALDDLTPSHTDAFDPNPAYPAEMQPRERGGAGAQLQVQRIAKNLEPDALLSNAGRTDAGPPIVGPDLLVESGNGRALALRMARAQYPERWAAYQQRLAEQARTLGIDPAAVAGVRDPVLVLERRTPVDRATFAAEANQSPTLVMGPYEKAVQDAARIAPETLAALTVREGQTIDAALSSKDNLKLVRAILAAMPSNERAALADVKGQLNSAGLERVKAALFAAVYRGDAGRRLTRSFVESIDPTLKNVEAGMFASLPQMARAEGLMRAGERDASLSLADDLAAAVDMLARLKQQGIRVADYVAQTSMFQRDLTPLQEQLLVHLDEMARSPKRVREFIGRYADSVSSQASSGQGRMFGDIAPPDKGELLGRASEGAIAADAGDLAAGRPAAPSGAAAPVARAGLEEPGSRAIPAPQARPVGPVQDSILAGLEEPKSAAQSAPAAGGTPRTPKPRPGYVGRLNVSKFPAAVQDAMRGAYEADPQGFEASARGVIPDADVARMAETVDIAPIMERWAPGTIWNAEEITAARNAVAKAFNDARLAGEGADSSAGTAALAEAVLRAQKIVGAGAELGRGLRSMRGTAEADALLNWREIASGGVEDAFAAVNKVHDDIERAALNGATGAERTAIEGALADARTAADDGYQAARNGVADAPVAGERPGGAPETVEVPVVRETPAEVKAAKRDDAADTARPFWDAFVQETRRILDREDTRAANRKTLAEILAARDVAIKEAKQRILSEFDLAYRAHAATEAAETARLKAQLTHEFDLAHLFRRIDSATELKAQKQALAHEFDLFHAQLKSERDTATALHALNLKEDRLRALAEQRQAAADARTAYKQRIDLENARAAAKDSARRADERNAQIRQQNQERALRAAEQRHHESMVRVYDAISDPARRDNVRRLASALSGYTGKLSPWQRALHSLRVAQRGRSTRPDQQQQLYRNLLKAVTQSVKPEEQAARIRQLRGIVRTGDGESMGRLLQQSQRPGFWQHVQGYYMFDLLSGGATSVRNILGTGLRVTTDLPVKIGAAAADTARVGVGNTALRLAGRTPTLERRTFWSEVPALAQGWYMGIRDAGGPAFKNIMRYGFNPNNLPELAGVRGEYAGGARNPMNLLFRQMGAADSFLKEMAHGAYIRAEAVAQAKREGLTGAAYVQRVADLVDVPPVATMLRAGKQSKIAVYHQDMKRLGQALVDIQSIPGMRFILTFVRTPLNVAKSDLEHSPAGVIGIGTDVLGGRYRAPDVMGLKPAEASAALEEHAAELRDLDMRVGRLLVGLGFLTTIMDLHYHDSITGPEPVDPRERDLWRQQGKQAYSIYVGGHWVDYSQWPGFNVTAAGTVTALEVMNRGDLSGPDKAAAVFQGILGALEQRSFVQSYIRTLDVLSQGVRQAYQGQRPMDALVGASGGALTSIGQGFVPASAALSRVAGAIDPVTRAPENFAQSIQARLPAVSRGVPAKEYLSGEPVRHDTLFDTSTPLGQAAEIAVDQFNPFRTTSDNADDPLLAEMQRLGVEYPQVSAKIGGQALTADQRRQFQHAVGQELTGRLGRLIATPQWRALGDDKRRAYIDAVKADVLRTLRVSTASGAGISLARPGEPPRFDPSRAWVQKLMAKAGAQDMQALSRAITEASSTPVRQRTPLQRTLAQYATTSYASQEWRAWQAEQRKAAETQRSVVRELATATP